jgi:uracil phosphoribosyltransferase
VLLKELDVMQMNQKQEERIRQLVPTVKCSFTFGQYERILMSQLRDKNTRTKKFRHAARLLGAILVEKVVECLPTTRQEIETPESICQGEILATPLDLVSVMRSGDVLLDIFLEHFPEANVSKILIQRDEETAKPVFKYMKLSPTISQKHPVVITEPMVATGGTLGMLIHLLKNHGVKEENMIIACICAAPEGLLQLSNQFPGITFAMSALDEGLNEKKFIVPGIGDFGDRYIGTSK